MATKSFRDVSKFRLFTIVGFSLLTSLSLSMNDSLWTLKEIVSALLQAGIAGFAYLQCPTINQGEKQDGRTSNLDGNLDNSANTEECDDAPKV